MDEENNLHWETKMFLNNQELDRCSIGLEEVAITGYSDSSSREEGSTNSSSSSSTKNVLLERNRRKKINDSFYALRSVVPNITRMDKSSILKDAIQYIQELQEQERRIVTEIAKLEEAAKDWKPVLEVDTEDNEVEGGEKIGGGIGHSPLLPPHPPSFLPTEVKVIKVGDGLFSVSVACNKNNDTMVKLCKALRPVKLRIIGANMTSLSGRLLHTLFVECDGVQEELKEKIEIAIGDFGFLPLEPLCYSSI